MKAEPTPARLILLIKRSARKSYVLVTWEVFLGFEDPVLSSLTESGPKWGPNCADHVPVQGARARLVQEHEHN